jgi:hypothetical protein
MDTYSSEAIRWLHRGDGESTEKLSALLFAPLQSAIFSARAVLPDAGQANCVSNGILI